MGEPGGHGDSEVILDPLGVNAPTMDENHAVFLGVTYLGSASIVAPKTEEDIHKSMELMNNESKCAITVNLLVPNNSEGLVRLVEPQNGSEISVYRIHRILFCA